MVEKPRAFKSTSNISPRVSAQPSVIAAGTASDVAKSTDGSVVDLNLSKLIYL